MTLMVKILIFLFVLVMEVTATGIVAMRMAKSGKLAANPTTLPALGMGVAVTLVVVGWFLFFAM